MGPETGVAPPQKGMGPVVRSIMGWRSGTSPGGGQTENITFAGGNDQT